MPLLLFWSSLTAASLDVSKLSPMLRRLARQQAVTRTSIDRQVCAFVKTDGEAGDLLARYGCTPLSRKGNVCIAFVPTSSIAPLSCERGVLRIEAELDKQLLMDSTALHVNATPAYAGANLPQAFTGKGVVMGIMDVGFDLTHPNFYDSTVSDYRIKALWDQLSIDTIGSSLPVGRDYVGRDALLAYAHSRDGLTQGHGSHTLGIAAGSGADSRYRGMAYESDICLVSNAVSDDFALIDSADIYKYTYAMDALGFQYIFDYADAHGQPCVISFSEGSSQDFRGDDMLYYEYLDSLVGPGRIIVASAGNDGWKRIYIHKQRGQGQAGSFAASWYGTLAYALRSRDEFALRFVAYGSESDTLTISSREMLDATATGMTTRHATLLGEDYAFDITGYPCCYDSTYNAYEVSATGPTHIGMGTLLSVAVVGAEADVELFNLSGELSSNDLDPNLCQGDGTHSILSPGSAPSVICAGATSYRTQLTNYLGAVKDNDWGTGGERAGYTSIGPTFDGRTKPDVLAPGSNVISSYNSYYMENNPQADALTWDVEHFDFWGRTYAWHVETGTSMSSPVVGGIIALWLEANPKLTPQDVLGVISRTSKALDVGTGEKDNYDGYGQIDAYAGLLDVLGLSGIRAIDSRHTASRTWLTGSTLHVDLGQVADKPFTARLFDVSGRLLHTLHFDAGQQQYSASVSLPDGLLIVQLPDGSTILKVAQR